MDAPFEQRVENPQNLPVPSDPQAGRVGSNMPEINVNPNNRMNQALEAPTSRRSVLNAMRAASTAANLPGSVTARSVMNAIESMAKPVNTTTIRPNYGSEEYEKSLEQLMQHYELSPTLVEYINKVSSDPDRAIRRVMEYFTSSDTDFDNPDFDPEFGLGEFLPEVIIRARSPHEFDYRTDSPNYTEVETFLNDLAGRDPIIVRRSNSDLGYNDLRSQIFKDVDDFSYLHQRIMANHQKEGLSGDDLARHRDDLARFKELTGFDYDPSNPHKGWREHP
jgi:hypothetical protein